MPVVVRSFAVGVAHALTSCRVPCARVFVVVVVFPAASSPAAMPSRAVRDGKMPASVDAGAREGAHRQATAAEAKEVGAVTGVAVGAWPASLCGGGGGRV